MPLGTPGHWPRSPHFPRWQRSSPIRQFGLLGGEGVVVSCGATEIARRWREDRREQSTEEEK